MDHVTAGSSPTTFPTQLSITSHIDRNYIFFSTFDRKAPQGASFLPIVFYDLYYQWEFVSVAGVIDRL